MSEKEADGSQTVKAQLRLRELIVGGELAPGERVPELALVERLGQFARAPLDKVFDVQGIGGSSQHDQD